MGSVISVISCQRRVGPKKFQQRVRMKIGLQRNGSEEMTAKRGSKEVAAKNITDITDPTPGPSP